MQAPACAVESFLPTLAKQPGLTIFTQIVRTLGKSTRVPVPADGNTVFAPTDAAFVALLQATGTHFSLLQKDVGVTCVCAAHTSNKQAVIFL